MNKVKIIKADTTLELERDINDFGKYQHIIQISYVYIPGAIVRQYQAMVLYKED